MTSFDDIFQAVFFLFILTARKTKMFEEVVVQAYLGEKMHNLWRGVDTHMSIILNQLFQLTPKVFLKTCMFLPCHIFIA